MARAQFRTWTLYSIRTLLAAYVIGWVPIFGSLEARAQESGLASIEGYVFDARTLRPVRGVRVTLQISSGSGTYGEGTVTDVNGFYSTTAFPPVTRPTVTSLFAICHTGKNDIRVDATMDRNQRSEIYQRNLYIKLPKGVPSCR
jgi:hypothetical protein